MKYQEIKKHIGQTRLLMLIVVLPVFAAVAFGPAVLTWLLHEKKHFLIAVLWMLFMGSVWIWQFIKTFTAGSKLKKIMETVGAETDEEMDALLEQAAAGLEELSAPGDGDALTLAGMIRHAGIALRIGHVEFLRGLSRAENDTAGGQPRRKGCK